MTLFPIILIASGGALGAVMRYVGMGLAGRLFGHSFPYGTLFINITGSLLMGILIGFLAKYISEDPTNHQNLHMFFAIGVLGSFTTFSTFSLDTVTLFERGEIITGMLYIIFSVSASIFALFTGLWLIR